MYTKKYRHSFRKFIANHRLAFTLIEILLVFTIIGIIAPTAYVGMNSYFAQAHDYERKKDLKDLETVMEEYYNAASAYPSAIPSCGEPLTYKNTVFVESFPCDPTTKKPYVYITDSLTNYQWYKIYTRLERNTDLSIHLIGCTNGCGPECAYNFGVASSNVFVTSCVWPATGIPSIKPTTGNTPTATPTIIQYITNTPTGSASPTGTVSTTPALPSPTPKFLRYVCAPGGGQPGYCEAFDDPDRSLCPYVYPDDPTCQNQCGNKDSRCKNSSGKYKPE